MKTMIIKVALIATLGVLLPNISFCQDYTGEVESFQSVLERLYEEMLPLCSRLIDVGRGLAGFGAMWYIASRIWRHIANAEPVDFYPLLRPFALGLAILLFPSVFALINSVLKPTVTGTAAMMDGSNNAIAYLLKKKEEAIRKTPAWQMYVGIDGGGDRDKWYRYTHPDGTEEGVLDGIGNDIKFAMAKASYNFRNSIKQWMSEILHVLYAAAALCINTIRTFYLIVLAILGPIVFGFSVFDGLTHTLTIWIARYINVFLWLPVANIFGSIIGKIQENMLKMDIQQVNQYGDTFFNSSDTAYLIFMIIGIVGYFTVPSVASYIVHASGANALLYKTTSLVSGGAQNAVSKTTGAATSLVTSSATDHGSRSSTSDQYRNNGYMHNKISGQ
jgi:conjugative transposon TraJ protein